MTEFKELIYMIKSAIGFEPSKSLIERISYTKRTICCSQGKHSLIESRSIKEFSKSILDKYKDIK